MYSNKHSIILCLNSENKKSLSFNKKKHELFDNSQIGIIILPLNNNSSDSTYYPGDTLVNYLQEKGLIVEGNILIKSPFNDSYHLATEASENFASYKHFIFTKICRFLGASEVLVEKIEISDESKTQSFKTQLGLKDQTSLVSVSGETNVDIKKTEIKENKFKLLTTFKGGEPDFPEVEKLINENRLTNEQNITFLVDFRQGNNVVTSLELNLDLSRESNRSFDILGNLMVSIPTLKEIKGIMEYKSSIKNTIKYNFTYKVTF